MRSPDRGMPDRCPKRRQDRSPGPARWSRRPHEVQPRTSPQPSDAGGVGAEATSRPRRDQRLSDARHSRGSRGRGNCCDRGCPQRRTTPKCRRRGSQGESPFCGEGGPDHGVLVACDVRSAGASEIEYHRSVDPTLRLAQVPNYQPPDILRERQPELGGPLACPSLKLRSERDLSSSRHDVSMISRCPEVERAHRSRRGPPRLTSPTSSPHRRPSSRPTASLES